MAEGAAERVVQLTDHLQYYANQQQAIVNGARAVLDQALQASVSLQARHRLAQPLGPLFSLARWFAGRSARGIESF